MLGLIAELQYFLLQATTVSEGVTALKVRDVSLFAFVFHFFISFRTDEQFDRPCLLNNYRQTVLLSRWITSVC